MPIRNNREYRKAEAFQIDKREANDDASFFVKGYASTFAEYELFEDSGIHYFERILPEAFEEADQSDCIFQRDHNSSVMARTRNNTLKLSLDEHGLLVEADLSKTTEARNMYEEIATGMYDQMSFAFTVEDDEIVKDSDSKYTRIIKRINKLFDVSAVSIPANPTTDISVALRDKFNGFIETEQLDLIEKRKKAEIEEAKKRFRGVQ